MNHFIVSDGNDLAGDLFSFWSRTHWVR
jgi:hypothetical protein